MAGGRPGLDRAPPEGGRVGGIRSLAAAVAPAVATSTGTVTATRAVATPVQTEAAAVADAGDHPAATRLTAASVGGHPTRVTSSAGGHPTSGHILGRWPSGRDHGAGGGHGGQRGRHAARGWPRVSAGGHDHWPPVATAPRSMAVAGVGAPHYGGAAGPLAALIVDTSPPMSAWSPIPAPGTPVTPEPRRAGRRCR